MSRIIQLPDPERIEEEACDWIAILDRGELTPTEEVRFGEWLAADQRHQDVLVEVAGTLDQMNVLSVFNKLIPLNEVSMTNEVSDRRRRIRFSTALGSSALALLALVGIILSGQYLSEPPRYRTNVGEVIDIAASDRSHIILNTDTELVVDYSKTERRVELVRGEAMFNVAHDPTRPFIVAAKTNQIIAIGTAFNVDTVDSDLEVTVTEGVVEVVHAGALDRKSRDTLSQGTQTVTRQRSLRLKAGEIIQINGPVASRYSLEPPAIATRLSWQKGELIFQGEALENVINEISRYSDKELVIADDSIKTTPVGGIFKTGDIANLLDVLDLAFGVKAEEEDGVIYLSSKQSHDQ